MMHFSVHALFLSQAQHFAEARLACLGVEQPKQNAESAELDVSARQKEEIRAITGAMKDPAMADAVKEKVAKFLSPDTKALKDAIDTTPDDLKGRMQAIRQVIAVKRLELVSLQDPQAAEKMRSRREDLRSIRLIEATSAEPQRRAVDIIVNDVKVGTVGVWTIARKGGYKLGEGLITQRLGSAVYGFLEEKYPALIPPSYPQN